MSSNDSSSYDSSKEKTSDKNLKSTESANISSQNKRTTAISPPANYYDDFFESFRQNFQNMMNTMERAMPSSLFPTMRSMTMTPFEMFDRMTDTRMPLCDVVDRGDKYEINLEVPGIDKDKIDIKATKFSIRISGEHSEKTKEKGKNYLYSERSYKSFHRQIPFTQEIIPSQVNAKVSNGILEVEVPKKIPTKVTGDEEYKVNIS